MYMYEGSVLDKQRYVPTPVCWFCEHMSSVSYMESQRNFYTMPTSNYQQPPQQYVAIPYWPGSVKEFTSPQDLRERNRVPVGFQRRAERHRVTKDA